MSKFEKVTRFKDSDIIMPCRKTQYSAGYDFTVAEDTVVPSWANLFTKMESSSTSNNMLTIDEMATITKSLKTKPSLVSTGMKCQLEPGTYLELSVRSSSPLKYWLILANGVGIIDADYYNNPDNEGEIFFQLINLSPHDIILRKGDAIGQGIIKKYELIDDDTAEGKRIGGFGSTNA